MENNNIENKVVYLRLDDIIPNRFQPREVFDETGLEELADSIKEHGVIQPVIVRQIGDKYELIAGERRSKASALAGLTTIPAIIRNMDDKESAKVSLLENLQRKNLSAIEEARTYKRILELDNMTQEDLAKTMGKSQPLIANKLRLLSLPEEVQDALIKNQISERHARSLLNVKDKKQQLLFLDRIKKERLTVRELDSEIKKMNEENQRNNEQTTSVSGGRSYNQINEPLNTVPTQEYRNNFNSMGLNDYQSVNNTMFNNIPSNYQTYTNQFNNIPDMSSPSTPSPTTNFDYTALEQDNTKASSFLNQPNDLENREDNYLNNPVNQVNQFSSLGSMFDGVSNGMQADTNLSYDANAENKNVFVSHIKEEEAKKQGNQFLPNFDDFPSNEGTSQGNFLNTPTNFNDSNYINSMDLDRNASLNNNQTFPENNQFRDSYTNFSNFNTNFNPNNNYEKPIDDFSVGQANGYNDNQGGLFNQPLNLVDVPKQEYKENPASYDFDSSYLTKPTDESTLAYQENETSEEEQTIPFDNPLDDPYENILFAKPVPIQKEEMQEEKKETVEEVEVIGEKDSNEGQEQSEDFSSTEKNEYINLDPVQTIFDTRGAVLELKKTTDRIKQNHIKIDTEEIDFDDVYQITIKIKKEEK